MSVRLAARAAHRSRHFRSTAPGSYATGSTKPSGEFGALSGTESVISIQWRGVGETIQSNLAATTGRTSAQRLAEMGELRSHTVDRVTTWLAVISALAFVALLA